MWTISRDGQRGALFSVMLNTSGGYRRALVIGNSAYPNDADALGGRLTDLGFDVKVEKDLTAEGFRRAISELVRDLAAATEKQLATSAVLFYAGHGVQVDGENYLLPVDCQIASKFDLKQQTIQLDVVLEALGSVARTGVVLLDCCRNNPLPQTLGPQARGMNASHGLANIKAPKGVYVAFATQPHFVALDGVGNNSPFTEALVHHVADPGKPVSEVMMAVRREVYDKTGGQQIPWDHSALFEPFAFAPGDPTRRPEGLSEEEWDKQTKAESKAREESYWQIVKRSDDIDFVRGFVQQFPNSEHRTAAADRIESLIVRGRRRRALPWIAASVVGLVLFAGLLTWWRMQPIADADIIGGDMEQDNGLYGFDATEFGCRLSCLTDRLDHPCVAYSYDLRNKRCYPKYEAVFFQRPSKAKPPLDPVNSEVMPGRALPVETSFITHWDRSLVGTPTPVAAVDKAPGPARQVVEDVNTKSIYWIVKSGGQCQQLCADLGSACRGFTYTRVTFRCSLFESVRGFVRDSINKAPVSIPGSFSGFSACTDRETPECADLPIARAAGAPSAGTPTPPAAAAPVRPEPVRGEPPAASPPPQ
jgi:hypothetical protein